MEAIPSVAGLLVLFFPQVSFLSLSMFGLVAVLKDEFCDEQMPLCDG